MNYRDKKNKNYKDEKDKNGTQPVYKNKFLRRIIYGIALTGYAVFTLLDAFVLPKNIVAMDNAYAGSSTEREDADRDEGGGLGESADSGTKLVTENSYVSDEISVTITTTREYDTQIYIANVVVSDVSYLRAGLAGGVFGRNIKAATSEIAQENNAILAINGDFYGFRDSGPVIRNGYLYRSDIRSGNSNEMLAVYKDGRFEILDETEKTAEQLLEEGVLQLFSFGPGLVENGEISVSANQEVDQAMTSNPRTAVGMISPLHYVFVVSDGRTSESEGLSLNELAQVMYELGCENAYNLDGGGSTTMWFMGSIVNVPTTNGRTISERSVSDIVYIGE